MNATVYANDVGLIFAEGRTKIKIETNLSIVGMNFQTCHIYIIFIYQLLCFSGQFCSRILFPLPLAYTI